jgi:hypothetical protein
LCKSTWANSPGKQSLWIDRYDELAPKLCLDGTFGGDLDSEERASLAEAYILQSP